MFNTAQWAGDYLAADIASIRMQVSNSGASDVTLRLIFVGGGQSVTTLAPVNLPAGSDWSTVSFPLTPDNLSGGTFGDVMANVGELNVVHSPAVIPARGSSPGIVAQVGLDNITAVGVPEPSGVALAAIASAAVLRRGRRRDRCD